jgi:tRNA (cytidine/uridine-2'-O-)-methyltransferase
VDVVLVAPEIATNTGNLIRLAANTGVALHLVKPLGFVLEDRLLRRAGLDYHELASVVVHESLGECLAALGSGRRRFTFRTNGRSRYDQVGFRADDVFVFGSERAGLTPEQREVLAPSVDLVIPMRPGNRSLNLANSVAVVVFEAWRQAGFAGAAGEPGDVGAPDEVGDPGVVGCETVGPGGNRPTDGHGLTSETLAGAPFDR